MRILLDTSFLLPSLGVEVTGAAEALENLEGNDFYYSKNLCGKKGLKMSF